MADIVYVMPKEKFVNGFVAFMDEFFPEMPLTYLLYGSDDAIGYVKPSNPRVIEVDSLWDVVLKGRCRSALKQSSGVILNFVNHKLLLMLRPFLYKTALLFWGADLYSLKEQRSGVKGMIDRLVIDSISKAKAVFTLCPGDRDLVDQICHPAGEHRAVMIFGGRREDDVPACWREREEGASPIAILLGNSATETNRHFELIDMLKSYAHEDILIYAPLSYGDREYGRQVIEAGKHAFDDKFIPLTSFMTVREYEQFLSKINIGVFNHNRQQGIGTVTRLLRMGAKVYLSDDGVLARDLREEGYVIFRTEDLALLDFPSFCAMDDDDRITNEQCGDMERYRIRAHEMWKEAYMLLQGGLRSVDSAEP